MVNITRVIDNVVTILFQNKAHDFFKGRLDLSGINYKKNVGHVIEMLLRKVGLDWSSSGRLLWWTSRGREAGSLAWKQPARAGSRKPADARPSTIGDLDDAELEHDATAAGAGSRAAQRAAEAARPEPPRVLERVRPERADRLKRGTGWGNVPRTLKECCVCEQEQLDALVLIGQEHAMMCGAALRRVHCDDAPHWSSHSIGVVNVFRLTCENGCSYNWSSARPLPGPPAKPEGAAEEGEDEQAEGEEGRASEGTQTHAFLLRTALERPTIRLLQQRQRLLRLERAFGGGLADSHLVSKRSVSVARVTPLRLSLYCKAATGGDIYCTVKGVALEISE